MKIKSNKGPKAQRPERAHGVNKPTHRDKREKESSVGHGMRAHELRFDKERIATVTANQQEKFIEKIKAKEREHGPKDHE